MEEKILGEKRVWVRSKVMVMASLSALGELN